MPTKRKTTAGSISVPALPWQDKPSPLPAPADPRDRYRDQVDGECLDPFNCI